MTVEIRQSVVSIRNAARADPALVRNLRRRLRRGLAHLGREADQLSVLLCDDQEIRSLNLQWREKDRATNVLSFPAGVPDLAGLPEGFPRILGDLAISMETCLREAEEVGRTSLEHATVLAAHGLLHLTGCDHGSSAARREMRVAEQDLIAAMVGRGRTKPGAGLL